MFIERCKHKRFCALRYVTVLSFLLALISSGYVLAGDNLDYVDPSIGGVGHILQPTRPTVQLPNKMIRMYPDRRDYLDDQIRSFSLTLKSHRHGMLFGLLPCVGDQRHRGISAWDQENEISTPYYYSVWLEDYDVTSEFVPGANSGIFRMTYHGDTNKRVQLMIHQGSGSFAQADDKARVVTGVEDFDGMHAYMYGQFDQPFKFERLSGDSRRQLVAAEFGKGGSNVIEFRYALSFISPEQAEANFDKEIESKSFEQAKADSREAWGKVIGQIKVEGGTDARRRTFYTALYRCYERMIDVSEGDRYYSNYDKKVHDADRPFYVDDWIWDTYLAHHPLRVILQPDVEEDMIDSYLRMYQQCGWLPQFPILTKDNPCMNGFHSTIMILDAYRKGLTDFDKDLAYEAMKKNAMEATMLPWKNGPACSLDRFYAEHGYYPALAPGEKETVPEVHGWEKRQSVAITLGHSYDDWALSEYASELGNEKDSEYFGERANNYKNLYWDKKGFFMPKNDKGEWINIDPAWDGGMGGRDYYDENNGWTYLWQVQHDIAGLVSLMGGDDRFEGRLDQLFRQGLPRSKYDTWAMFPDFTGIVGQYSMGNEPSFHIPYLYNYVGSPWKTQKKIRMLLNAWFPDNIFGIPGDEDGGGMSAFVVFSCMGFYPMTPGLPIYTVGSPVFEKITIDLPNGRKFRVTAQNCSETNKYIQKASLNGKELVGPWFTHDDLIKGGHLELVMGQKPNKSWGSNVELYNELVKQVK